MGPPMVAIYRPRRITFRNSRCYSFGKTTLVLFMAFVYLNPDGNYRP